MRHYNLRRREWRPALGSLVSVKQHQLSREVDSFAAKLAPKYVGPFRVLKFISPNIVRIQRPGERKRKVANIAELREFRDELDSDEEATTEAERDNPSCSSEMPDESTRDTSLGSTSPDASPRYGMRPHATRLLSMRHPVMCPRISRHPGTSRTHASQRRNLLPRRTGASNLFPAGGVIPLTQHPLSTWRGIRMKPDTPTAPTPPQLFPIPTDPSRQ